MSAQIEQIVETTLISETAKGSLVKNKAILKFSDGVIEFLKSPFSLKDEIKSMKGSKWGGIEEPPRKSVWIVEDCPRNRFQLRYLMGENPYEWFDRPLQNFEYDRPLMAHQREMSDYGLTYHYSIWAAEMGVGKTLSAIEVIEKSGVKHWYWLGPKSSLPAIRREFVKWGLDESITVDMMTYTSLVRHMDEWSEGQMPPGGVIFDECSRLKTESSQRTRAAQFLADLIRHHYGNDGYVIEMSGTPSPKRPTDWWSLAEIAYPGFLKEGSPKALEQRLAFLVQETYDAGSFQKRIGWKDDERKCAECGMYDDHPNHELELPDEVLGIVEENEDYHEFVPSKNEVSYMFDRLQGLVLVKHKKDCLELPEKRYRKMICKPTSSIMRVAQAITHTSPNAMQAATLLRELSDGFQYRDVDDGFKPCDHCEETGMVAEWYDPEDEERTFRAIDMLDEELQARLVKDEVVCPACGGEKKRKKYKRITREVPCPKEAALEQLLDENSERGRIVIFAGFTGSVDRCVNICLKNRWDIVRCDGRGFTVMQVQSDGEVKVLPREDALEYWSDLDHERVAFVAHPESGGMGLTLTEACMAVFWSNSFKPEYRVQAEDRIHRVGIDENKGATIVDLIHLPTDEKVLATIRENRKLELMTMGEIEEVLVDEACGEDGEIVDEDLHEVRG